jgi:hypothetical protein
MNIYEKAVAGLALAGHEANVIQQSATDIGVWIEVWNNDLLDTRAFRIHDEEITWWAFYYDEQQNEKQ